MSEVKKIATRESYGNALVELGKLHDDVVVLDADLAGATKTGMFKKAFPERFIDCGIAEGNMIGVAAGIATTGKVPFASTFAMFAAGRAFEQVRNSVGYPKNNVKIGATHAGISVGASRQPFFTVNSTTLLICTSSPKQASTYAWYVPSGRTVEQGEDAPHATQYASPSQTWFFHTFKSYLVTPSRAFQEKTVSVEEFPGVTSSDGAGFTLL